MTIKKVEDLTIGEPYIVSGRGEMLLVEFEENQDKDIVCRMREHGRGHLWCLMESLVRKATMEDIQSRHEQAQARNVSCNNPDCWCVKYRAKAKT